MNITYMLTCCISNSILIYYYYYYYYGWISFVNYGQKEFNEVFLLTPQLFRNVIFYFLD